MLWKTTTIIVAPSSLADALLLSITVGARGLSFAAPEPRYPAGLGWFTTEEAADLDGWDGPPEFQRAAVCLAWLRRHGLVHRIINDTRQRAPLWQASSRQLARVSLPDGRVQWTAEVEA